MQSETFARQQHRFFGAPVRVRVIYAVIAALLWWAMAETDQTLPDDYAGALFWATGAVFSALVLVPYLPNLKGNCIARALGLLCCGAFSYWWANAVLLDVFPAIPWLLVPFDSVKSWPDILESALYVGIAGVYGALIVGVGARLLIPLRLRLQGWLFLAAAGLLGGALVGIRLHAGVRGAFVDLRYDYVHWLPGHMAWEVLVCVALYFGAARTHEPRPRIGP